jgi:hypothetical protein
LQSGDLRDAEMKELVELKNLRSLDLQWIPVTDAGLKELSRNSRI